MALTMAMMTAILMAMTINDADGMAIDGNDDDNRQ
jgi:hypothetical protein